MAGVTTETPGSAVTNLLSQNRPAATSTSTDTEEAQLPEFAWLVKPCFIYKEEYKECKSFKARFHQYFIHGETTDCQQWKTDYDNCEQWESKEDLEALTGVIESERHRIRTRLRAHYANKVWEQRTEPPPDWNKPLPDSISRSYEGSVLKKKADELRSGEERLGDISGSQRGEGGPIHDDGGSSCSIV